MNVLVMGGTRFNGLALVHELARSGHRVSVLNRGVTPADLPDTVERLVADRTDAESVARALGDRRFDCVQDMSAYTVADVQTMVDLLRGRTEHYIFVSSTAIYPPAKVLPVTEDTPGDRTPNQNDYGNQKLDCEELLWAERAASGFPATVVALSMVFGPHNIVPAREQQMFVRLLTGRPVLIPGDGTTLGQVGYVGDEARGLQALMGLPTTFGKRYTLTGKDYFTSEGYVDVFAQVVGRPANKVFVPPAVMDRLWDGELVYADGEVRSVENGVAPAPADRTSSPSLFELSSLIQRVSPNLHRWNQSTLFSIDRLRTDTGWEPQLDFPSMVAVTYDWFRTLGDAGTAPTFDFGFEDALLRFLGA